MTPSSSPAAAGPYLVLSTSLNPDSRSRVLARAAERHLSEAGAAVRFVDLVDYPLPLCDAGAAYDHPALPELNAAIASAPAILVATAVYNYDVNAALKNLVELTGGSWEGRIVGFLCAAGGQSSYMSVMSFANSLMLDFRSLIIPRFVYAQKGDFADEKISSAKVKARVAELAAEALRLGTALEGVGSAA